MRAGGWGKATLPSAGASLLTAPPGAACPSPELDVWQQPCESSAATRLSTVVSLLWFVGCHSFHSWQT